MIKLKYDNHVIGGGTIPKQTFRRLKKEKQLRIFDAALDEFSNKSFNEVKISSIIKEAKIPRGSFYQYFENKLDLYKYVFYALGERKMEYMGELLPNPDEIPFLELFRQLYKIGIKFAIDNPKGIKMMRYLFSSKDLIYKEIMHDGLNQAKEFYRGYIESDKKLGRINPDIDTEVFTEMVINLINNISIEEFSNTDKEINYNRMLDKFNKIAFILEKGILIGDK